MWCEIQDPNYGILRFSEGPAEALYRPPAVCLTGPVVLPVRRVTHRHPGARSDSGHKLSLGVGRLPLDPLEAVQSGGEVVQQTLFLYLPLPLKRHRKKTFREKPRNLQYNTNSFIAPLGDIFLGLRAALKLCFGKEFSSVQSSTWSGPIGSALNAFISLSVSFASWLPCCCFCCLVTKYKYSLILWK